MIKLEMERCVGFCIKHECEVVISYPKGVIWALPTCSICGEIRETDETCSHVISSRIVLEYLKKKSCEEWSENG